MPATRKSSRQSAGASKQSTLSFNHRVTKSVPKSVKDTVAAVKPSSLSKEYVPERAASTPPKVEDLIIEDAPSAQQTEAEATPEVEKSDAELRAERISAVSIDRYWGQIEASRTATAVHKKHGDGLTIGEKILRYFDVSSQYGPSVGTARRKRWERADRLGLNPPIEVLAVLIKEQAAGNKAIERAHMDELLNSTAVGSV
ncbi:DNA polymerase delta, subunit 4-domain-containing protein [Lasiosphaeris hirsuta]|uniref:DNA polymerase delta, subunit 4-domain-containing protein n=1 Tax=Lasiosphaeris hirsuta TaxID=260670 RepID=A0AA39ZWF7_9PEZI|nr:DNA polymerase delta, subunit 4-domain-containing protein [Lasiosphaeris hirsuta]